MGSFCTRCGEARPIGAQFCAQCGNRFQADTSGSWRQLQSSLQHEGFFNVESGHCQISTKYFDSCECHLAPEAVVICNECGRTKTTSIEVATGHGDGVYPVFSLGNSAGQTGAMAVFVETFARELDAGAASPADVSSVAAGVLVGELDVESVLLLSDAFTGWNDSNITVDVPLPAGKYFVVAWIANVPTLVSLGDSQPARPIAVGIYSSNLMGGLNSVASVDRSHNAYKFRPFNLMAATVMSHSEPQWSATALMNFERDNARGKPERAMSWLLQAAHHGSDRAGSAVSEVLSSATSEDANLRARLLAERGQRNDSTNGDASSLTVQAMSEDVGIREAARAVIIEEVNVQAMNECANKAIANGDLADAEFWMLEIATAPSTPGVIEGGIFFLCQKVLIPEGRFEESELYARHLISRGSGDALLKGHVLLQLINTERTCRGGNRLVKSDAWETTDLNSPVTHHSDQQRHYDRAYAYLNARAQAGQLQELLTASQDDFMPYITGWLIGVETAVNQTGATRETFAKATCDLLQDLASPNIAVL